MIHLGSSDEAAFTFGSELRSIGKWAVSNLSLWFPYAPGSRQPIARTTMRETTSRRDAGIDVCAALDLNRVGNGGCVRTRLSSVDGLPFPARRSSAIYRIHAASSGR